MRQTCIFAGSSHPALVDAICHRVGQKPAQVDLKKFSNGETSVEIKTSVRDQDVFVVQGGSAEINDAVMELLIMISACKGGSARSITAVMPYFPYSRQSKKKTHRGAITARMLANLMKVAGVNHVITIDLHATQMQGFFQCPVDNLIAEPIIAKWIRHNVKDWSEGVVVSKNPGGTKRVTSLADALKLSFGVITTDRRRPYITNSMMNSTIFEPMGESLGPDAMNGRRGREEEGSASRSSEHGNAPKEQDFAHRHAHFQTQELPERTSKIRTAATMPLESPPRMPDGAGNSPASSDAKDSNGADEVRAPRPGILRHPTALGIEQRHTDDDGYEEAAGENDQDEAARDVITGRLIQGHIVEDDATSPTGSTRSSFQDRPHDSRHSSEEEIPEQMTQSFISTTSCRMQGPRGGLGGTGDATASDEEEEEALQDPEIETTVTLVGSVRDRPVLIIDDMIDKAGSWIAAAETVVKRGGATKVYIIATHGLFGGDCLKELEQCDQIEKIIVTNAFPIPEEKRRAAKKLEILDVSGLLAEAIRRNHHGESISQLYQHFD